MDVIQDNSRRHLMKLANIVGTDNLPDYVNDYIVPDTETASALLDSDFADPGKRAFPIESPGSTWISAGYYMLDKKDRDKEADFTFKAIKRAGDIWGIQKDIENLMLAVDTFNGPTKSAADNDSNYGWLIKDAEGNVVRRRYPMFDSEGVVKAAEFFMDNRRQYPRVVRKDIATKIVEKAAEYGVSFEALPDALEREAGLGIPRKTVIMRELNERAQLAKDAEFSVLLSNVSRLVGNSEGPDFAASMDKLAETIDAFDQAEDLVKHYGTRISYPADFLFSITQKEAADFTEKTVTLRKMVFDIEKLASSVPLSVFVDVLGDGFASRFHKEASEDLSETFADSETLRSAVNLLPKEDKAALEDHLVYIYQ